MVAGLGLGVDVMLDPTDLAKSFAPGRNFCTKLWNIGRFLLSRVGTEPVRDVASLPAGALTAADAWILARLDAAIGDCDAALGPPRPAAHRTWTEGERGRGLRLSEYAEAARRFVWNELADWYLESVKPRLAAEGEDREVARAVLAHAFDGALRLLHPIVPFITEALWQQLPGTPAGAFLALAPWPVPRAEPAGDGAPFALAQEAVVAIRQLRADYGVPAGQWVDVVVVAPAEGREALAAQAPMVAGLARARLATADAPPAGASAQALLRDGVELCIPLAGMVDLDKERARLATELAELERHLTALEGRLANEKFTAKAPPALVEAERGKAAEWRGRRDQLAAKLAALGA
jgi:valyl-tRNA synthetase